MNRHGLFTTSIFAVKRSFGASKRNVFLVRNTAHIKFAAIDNSIRRRIIIFVAYLSSSNDQLDFRNNHTFR